MHYDENGSPINRPAFPHFLKFIVLVVLILLLSMVGGVSGFVLMSNSNLSGITKLRHALHIDDGGLSVPVKQTLRLEETSSVIDAAKKVSPAVVSITASQQVADFFGQVSSQEVSGGTGFIITSDGLIVTNKHVVSAQASYKVVLNDGRILDATVKAIDPTNDFAVVKVEAKDLPTVDIGNSDDLQVGQYVIAVGNALGEFRNSVTLGVISAKQRSLQAGGGSTSTESLSGLLQTDASINPGNSGGPLVNLLGQVVGINTAIASPSGGSIGIGFALPINSVKKAIESVRKNGEIIRPYLGVRYLPVTASLKQLNSLSVDYGALVSRGEAQGEVAVLPGSPADKAGILENDIILQVNGDRITQDTPLPQLLQNYAVGDTVELKLLRKGMETTVKVKLEKLKTN